eukprot:CAMPEP_0202887926 /NCGR_PEP_ID=MMETSP1391-20130828/42935_1 /ASSEMBLY_ACC=CAM_ASM_000867 /TAXON_ID=1034604 /ORGANISM="Chlamydomonas leiostraca, Strain SAG 11-49" /LENGTH=123 /DNA_ID=CAMNT_0049571227 /DNA_START=224 /DNA_END=595 /DNA_ORIENTATION=+
MTATHPAVLSRGFARGRLLRLHSVQHGGHVAVINGCDGIQHLCCAQLARLQAHIDQFGRKVHGAVGHTWQVHERGAQVARTPLTFHTLHMQLQQLVRAMVVVAVTCCWLQPLQHAPGYKVVAG